MDPKRPSYQCTVRWTMHGVTKPFLHQQRWACTTYVVQVHLCWCNLHPRHYKSLQLYPKRNSNKEWSHESSGCQQQRKLLTLRFFSTHLFFLQMKSMTRSTFLNPFPSVVDDVVYDLPLYGTSFTISSGLHIAPDSLVVERSPSESWIGMYPSRFRHLLGR